LHPRHANAVDAEYEDRERVRRVDAERPDEGVVEGTIGALLARAVPRSVAPAGLALIAVAAQLGAFFLVFDFVHLAPDDPGRATWRSTAAAIASFISWACVVSAVPHAMATGRVAAGAFWSRAAESVVLILAPAAVLGAYGATAVQGLVVAVLGAAAVFSTSVVRAAAPSVSVAGGAAGAFVAMLVHGAFAIGGAEAFAWTVRGFALVDLVFGASVFIVAHAVLSALTAAIGAGTTRSLRHAWQPALEMWLLVYWFLAARSLEVWPWDSVAPAVLAGLIGLAHGVDALQHAVVGTWWPKRSWWLTLALAALAGSTWIEMFRVPLGQETLLGLAFAIATWRAVAVVSSASRALRSLAAD